MKFVTADRSPIPANSQLEPNSNVERRVEFARIGKWHGLGKGQEACGATDDNPKPSSHRHAHFDSRRRCSPAKDRVAFESAANERKRTGRCGNITAAGYC